MSAAILAQGSTAIRDALKALITHVVLSDDTAGFSTAQMGINPTAGTTSTHVEAATDADVDGATFDSTIVVNGASEMTNKYIQSIGVSKGTAIRAAAGSGGTHTGGGTVGTDTLTRSVRSLGIGVESTDTYTIGVRTQVQDNS